VRQSTPRGRGQSYKIWGKLALFKFAKKRSRKFLRKKRFDIFKEEEESALFKIAKKLSRKNDFREKL
jgi:hypothetical protein